MPLAVGGTEMSVINSKRNIDVKVQFNRNFSPLFNNHSLKKEILTRIC